MSSVETHMRINLRQVAERLSMSEAALARSVSASLPRQASMPAMVGAASPAGATAGAGSADGVSPTRQDRSPGALDRPEHSNASSHSGMALLPPINSSAPDGRPRPKASAPIRIARPGEEFDPYDAATPPAAAAGVGSYGATGTPVGRTHVAGTYSSGMAMHGAAAAGTTPPATRSSMLGTTPSRSVLMVGSVQRNDSFAIPMRATRTAGAVRRYTTRDEAMGLEPPSSSPALSAENSPSHREGRHTPMQTSADERTLTTPLMSSGGQQTSPEAPPHGPSDLVLSTNADGRVEVSFVPRDESPTALSRQSSRLTGTRSESRMEPHRSSPEAAPAKPGKKPKKQVHFPTEPISQVTIFQTEDKQVVMQVQYRRPSWCLLTGAIAAVLRALVWTLVGHVLYVKMKLEDTDMIHYTTDMPARVRNDVTESIAIATRMGFEIYAGSAVLFALLMAVFWRPSARDVKSLHQRREQLRLALCVISGALSRVLFAVSLGIVISAVYVGLHHALPLIWLVLFRAKKRNKPMAFPDLLSCSVLCAAMAVMVAGDMLEALNEWQIQVKWLAMPVVIVSSILRAVQRYKTKSLKAHFSFRLMLLATMCADALVMLIAALAADYQVLSRIASADATEIVSAVLAICSMLAAVVSDVLLAKYFDLLSGQSLTVLVLPAALAFFRAFGIGSPAVTYIMITALMTVLSVVMALGSGEVNRKTKSLVLDE